jgi:ABC-type nitrate/sulfonate/bicarbonate transport system ATPase subunit
LFFLGFGHRQDHADQSYGGWNSLPQAPTGARRSRNRARTRCDFQSYSLMPWLTVKRQRRAGRTRCSLNCPSTAPKVDHYATVGSPMPQPAAPELGGMRQRRVNVARALAMGP